MALSMPFLLFNLVTALLCEAAYISTIIDDASTQVVYTPPVCNRGEMVAVNRLPGGCDTTWFITSIQNNPHQETWHATQSPGSMASLQFQGTGVSWFSAPNSQGLGTADVFLDNAHMARVHLSSNNTGEVHPVWSIAGLDQSGTHNLTVAALGDGIVTVDFFTVLSSHDMSTDVLSSNSSSSSPDVPVHEDTGGAVKKDGSSGAVISAASIGSVALVVFACGGCFFLGKRRKRPGFHMPTVLVDIESALDEPDPPSPTSIRAWRESTRKVVPLSQNQGESSTNHERQHSDGTSKSRPPSYRSGKDPSYLSESSQSHEDPWQ